MKTEKPIALDLFSGCGGLTLGLKRAGFSVIGAVEIEQKAQDTYSKNHPDVALYRGDIRELSVRDALRWLGIGRGELDLLAGCPPCQGFSRLRRMNRGSAVRDSRNSLLGDFGRFVEQALPKTVMLENVPGLVGHPKFRAFRRLLVDNGYRLTFDVLDAADFGVPQRRHRLILLASRIHDPKLAAPLGRKVTVKNAIGRLAPPGSSLDAVHRIPERRSQQVRALIRRIPKDGGSRSNLPKEMQLPCHLRSNGFFDVYGRMSWNDVSPTITSGCHNPSKGRFLHPTSNRTITLREASVLQGFPLKYKFDVSHGKEGIALLIGNALPPPFIAAHARELMFALKAT